ncbi:TPA: hypothetical protein ACNVAS_003374 [Citrobacter amalonaticus]|uniref:hypothetical protein n=1 Tax=Citrobacter TaxID=544 RepID=UPI000AEED39F|nr:hypothetical protein [Citrobacter amalonaticus]MDV2138586.1 hypothetical protein [Citrobacter amalonaticus]MEB0586093.1 hypothetical protein [Citrobacter amalonaticus]
MDIVYQSVVNNIEGFSCVKWGERDLLTFYEIASINHRLLDISDTWADLWVCLHYLPVGIGRVRMLRYTNLVGSNLTFEQRGRLKEINIIAPSPVRNIILRRREIYPDDVYVFQSHSNRVKAEEKPVTVVAFNRALKLASSGVTTKNVTSKCA